MSQTQPNFQFGSGYIYCIPNAGNLAANPTPFGLGILQDSQLDVKGDIKKLFGQKQLPVAKARGKIDVMVKSKFATLDPLLLNQLYWGQTATPGMKVLAADEADTIGTSGSPPTANQVSVVNAVNFQDDYGVKYAVNGVQFTKLASGPPAQGQYTETNGTYVFNAAENGSQVLISYTWLDSTKGNTVQLVSQTMGYAPEFQAVLFNQFQGNIFMVELYSCMMGSFSLPTKQEDFWVMDVDLEASTNAASVLGNMYAGSLT